MFDRKAYMYNYNRTPGSKAAIKKYRKSPKGKAVFRKARLKRFYKLTPDDWDKLFESQGRVCASCKSDDPRHKNGWHTDHCHTTDVVRGILCFPCNAALGACGDSSAKLRAMADYIERWV